MYPHRHHYGFNPLRRIQAAISGAIGCACFGVCIFVIMFIVGITLLVSGSNRAQQISEYNDAVDKWNDGARNDYEVADVRLVNPSGKFFMNTDSDKNHISPRSGEEIKTFQALKRDITTLLYSGKSFRYGYIPNLEIELSVNGTELTERVPIFKSERIELNCDPYDDYSTNSCRVRCADKDGELISSHSRSCRVAYKLVSVCLVLDVANQRFKSGSHGCLASNYFSPGKYEILKPIQYDYVSTTGNIMVRSSDDPFFRLNKIVGRSLSFDATLKEKRTTGTILLIIACAPFCCCFIFVSLLVVLCICLFKGSRKAPSNYQRIGNSSRVTSGATLRQSQPNQPYYQNQSYQPPPPSQYQPRNQPQQYHNNQPQQYHNQPQQYHNQPQQYHNQPHNQQYQPHNQQYQNQPGHQHFESEYQKEGAPFVPPQVPHDSEPSFIPSYGQI